MPSVDKRVFLSSLGVYKITILYKIKGDLGCKEFICLRAGKKEIIRESE